MTPSCGKCEPLKIMFDPNALADMLYPEARTDAALYKIATCLRTNEVQLQLEVFLASTLKLMAQSNAELTNTIVDMARRSTTPAWFFERLATPTPKDKENT